MERQGTLFALPDGGVLDVGRRRSAGLLTGEELAACRAHAIALAYDPVQRGWVTLACEDDIDEPPPARDAMQAGSRCVLRPWRLEDLPRFVALLDDPRVWEHLPDTYPAPLTPEIARDLIEIANQATHHEVRAIEVDGAAVGQIRLAFASDDRRQAEIGYWLGRAHWGRGIAGEAVALYTRLAFAHHPSLAFLHAVVHPENHASARVLAKAGYREAGACSRNPSWRSFRIDRGDPGSGG